MRLLLLALFTFVYICSGCRGDHRSATISNHANTAPTKQVLDLIAPFVDADIITAVRDMGVATRRDSPPFAKCYRLRVPLPLDPIATVEAGENQAVPVYAELWMEVETQRIVLYQPQPEYFTLKSRLGEFPKESDLVSESQAAEVSEGAIRHARLSAEGVALKTTRLVRPQRDDRYFRYIVLWAKYTELPRIGRVELPVTIWTEVDARSGELDALRYREYPLLIDLEAPRISRESAVRIASAQSGLADVAHRDAHLRVVFDYRGVSDDQMHLSISDPQRFYEEVSKTRQVLAWEVSLTGRPVSATTDGSQTPVAVETEITALIDAKTGELIAMPMPL